MNPISTFEPMIGAHVHDTLDNLWITLTATGEPSDSTVERGLSLKD
jgi:hypothetical protein